jgi:hypothetical protein
MKYSMTAPLVTTVFHGIRHGERSYNEAGLVREPGLGTAWIGR